MGGMFGFNLVLYTTLPSFELFLSVLVLVCNSRQQAFPGIPLKLLQPPRSVSQKGLASLHANRFPDTRIVMWFKSHAPFNPPLPGDATAPMARAI
jgi:hypothetical protein